MRIALLGLLCFVGCAHTEPAADTTNALNKDLRLFCSDEARAHVTSPNEFLGWYGPQTQSDEMHDALLRYQKSGSIEELRTTLDARLQTAGLVPCATRDVLFNPR